MSAVVTLSPPEDEQSMILIDNNVRINRIKDE
jgi:hypothetical protein